MQTVIELLQIRMAAAWEPERGESGAEWKKNLWQTNEEKARLMIADNIIAFFFFLPLICPSTKFYVLIFETLRYSYIHRARASAQCSYYAWEAPIRQLQMMSITGVALLQ